MAKAQDIAAQHEELEILARRLAVVAQWKPGFLADGHLRRLLAEDLKQLLGKLKGHFASEEEGGYMSAVLEKDPNAAPKVEVLKKEHGAFLSQFSDLYDECAGEGFLEDIKSRVAEALQQLKAHEQAENALMQSVLTTDRGAGD